MNICELQLQAASSTALNGQSPENMSIATSHRLIMPLPDGTNDEREEIAPLPMKSVSDIKRAPSLSQSLFKFGFDLSMALSTTSPHTSFSFLPDYCLWCCRFSSGLSDTCFAQREDAHASP
jgi:hypothetical protein